MIDTILYCEAYGFHFGTAISNELHLSSIWSLDDEIAKVDDKWLFGKRKIYKEQVADWVKPSWLSLNGP